VLGYKDISIRRVPLHHLVLNLAINVSGVIEPSANDISAENGARGRLSKRIAGDIGIAEVTVTVHRSRVWPRHSRRIVPMNRAPLHRRELAASCGRSLAAARRLLLAGLVKRVLNDLSRKTGYLSQRGRKDVVRQPGQRLK
jgi:hypothetical protein